MGTKKLKSEYTEYFVLPKTKKVTFIYKTSFDTSFSYIVQTSDKFNNPITYCARSKNNLVIITKYVNKTTLKIKTVKTVFKNYFKNKYNNKITFNNYDDNSNPIIQELSSLNLTQNKSGKITDDTSGYILGSNKKDTYTLTKSYGNKIYDEKGNDIYNVFFSGNVSYIYDFSGKDKYDILNSADTKIFDFNGKDTYTITKSNTEIIDYLGDDKYFWGDGSIVSSDNLVKVLDKKGKDKYDIKQFDNIELTDERGIDSYKIKFSKNIYIVDNAGNDYYKADNSTNITFEDYLGNDEYNVINLSQDIEITDYSGVNQYILKNSDGITINDKSTSAKTTYEIENIGDLEKQYCMINDLGGNDSYKILGSKNIVINDYNLEKDSYNITNSTITINDFGISGDNYTISAASGKINDKGGNDIYNISELSGKIEIFDEGGFDKIDFKNSKQAELVFMADFDSSGNSNGDMIIYDSSNCGQILVKDFYEVDENNFKAVNDSSAIEKIYAAKEDITSKILSTTTLNKIQSEVSAWFSGKSYLSVSDALLKAEQNEIKSLIQAFSADMG